MENTPKENEDSSNSLETLEDPSTVPGGQGTANASSASGGTVQKPQLSLGKRVRQWITHINVYLLLFILIVVLAGGIVIVSIQRGKKAAEVPTIATTPLTQEAIEKLEGSSTKVGDPKQTLSIESNAIFAGKVLIRDSLDVAGTIKVGGALSLPGLSVSGTSTFEQIAANKVTVSGDTNIGGQLNLQKSLTVAGGATFGGGISAPSININSLQLNSDLPVAFHIDAGGGAPGGSIGSAVGIGGTASVSGTDTAGTINVNTGGGAPAGCFITVNFARRFSGSPHVVVTPVGAGGAGLSYYVNRNNNNFSLCTASTPPSGASFSFDYIVID